MLSLGPSSRRLSSQRCARSIEASIERHTRPSRDHLTPELQLRLLTPECPLYRARDADKVAHFEEPFWAIYWPGGQALARYLLDEGGRLFRGRPRSRVLDLGAGCGAAAIAAKLAGAGDALANDTNEVACVAARMNARLNGVEVRTCSADLTGREAPAVDLLLVGDLLYDEATAARLAGWLDGAAAGGAEVLLGDPGRHGLTDELRRRLVRLRTYPLTESGRRENHGYDSATVWRYTRDPEARDVTQKS